MQVGELCQRLDVSYRHARYVLEEGILPHGVEGKPGRGEHRQLKPAQAFWLGIVLMLKQSGVQTSLAGKIADYARQAVRTLAQHLNWEHTFEPFLGKFETNNQWFVDIGDLKHVRLATTADPSSHDEPQEFPWSEIVTRKRVEGVAPVVTIRLDLSRLAQLIRG